MLASTGEVLPTDLAALQAVHWNEDEVYRFLLAFYGQPGDAMQAAAASDELKARFNRSRWAASACRYQPILLLPLAHQPGAALQPAHHERTAAPTTTHVKEVTPQMGPTPWQLEPSGSCRPP